LEEPKEYEAPKVEPIVDIHSDEDFYGYTAHRVGC